MYSPFMLNRTGIYTKKPQWAHVKVHIVSEHGDKTKVTILKDLQLWLSIGILDG